MRDDLPVAGMDEGGVCGTLRTLRVELFESWSSSLKNLLSIALVRESTRVLTWLTLRH